MSLLLSLLPLLATAGIDSMETTELIDLSAAEAVETWRPVHDVVMGGVSRGEVRAIDGAARFQGHVSLENNGGFASFRTGAKLPDLTEWDGLRLTVLGDGQVYKLGLRTDGAWDGVSWQAPFATRDGEWTSVELDFDALVPTWRGRLVADATAFDPSKIAQVAISISDKQEGSFQLDLAGIEAWRVPVEATPSAIAASQVSSQLARLVEAEGGADELMDLLRWKERVLVVSGSSELDARASKQLGHLLANREGLADRDLRIVNLMGDRGGRVAGRTLDQAVVRGLRERFELSADETTVALVGKDGGVKAVWKTPVHVDTIFERIDGMPMRREELRSRTANR